jgi:hypothetical protein
MAFKIRNRNPPRVVVFDEVVVVGDVGALSGIFSDIIADSAESSHFLCCFVANLNAKFFFDGHERFDHVEGVEAQVVVEGGGRCQIGFVYTQFFTKNLLYFGRNLCLIDNGVHNQYFENSFSLASIGVEIDGTSKVQIRSGNVAILLS